MEVQVGVCARAIKARGGADERRAKEMPLSASGRVLADVAGRCFNRSLALVPRLSLHSGHARHAVRRVRRGGKFVELALTPSDEPESVVRSTRGRAVMPVTSERLPRRAIAVDV